MFLRPSKSTPKIETIIGSGTEMEGNIHTKESIRIDGKIKGELHAHGVVIGQFGVVMGDINASIVTVAGKIKGNVFANESLELLSKSQLLGDIHTAKLMISDGANFEGNCQMIKSNGQVIELPQDGHKNLKVLGANGKHV